MQEKGNTMSSGMYMGVMEDFLLLKEKIEKRDPEATIILTGDFLDQGTVWEMLGWAVENIRPGGKYQSVLGNHEEMFWSGTEWRLWYQSDHQKRNQIHTCDFDMVMRSHDALALKSWTRLWSFWGNS